MNRAELTAAMAAHADLTKADAGRALDAFCEAVTAALSRGDDVALVGFGTFAVKAREARTGRNPATGAEIQIPASRTVGFKPGKQLKDAVN
jgi:DNA-binding protein HU-beta